jgi:PrgI family protein
MLDFGVYNIHMQFEVPQFIEIEDKIFGPLSWRQFLYLGGGIGGAAAIFLTLGLVVFVLIGLPLAILAAALAFYPVNNRPFSYFLEALVNYLKGNKLYLWRRNQEIVHKQSFIPKQIPNSPLINNSAEAAGKNISSLARRLELEALQKKE